KDTLDSGHEAEAQEALQLLIHVATKSLSYPSKALQVDLIDVVVNDMLLIAQNHYLEDWTRQLATEFILLFQTKLCGYQKNGLFE
ncbi:hypothetical protein A2U01_0078485, partial [Trifolium medium]|nr:hypothetical protein [Trifolium medium]